MTAARRFSAVSCRAADHFVASLDAMNCLAVDHLVASLEAANCPAADHFVASLVAGLNHDSLRASRRASTRADRCVAEYHRFAAGQVVASPAAASCLETADRPGASLGRPPVGAALRGARPATTGADRHGAGRHLIAFHCAKAPHRAIDCCFLCRVHSRVQSDHGLSHLTPLTPGDATSARRRAPAACNRACEEAARSDRLNCVWALTGSGHRPVRSAQTSSGRRATCLHGSGASRAARRRPGFGEIQLEIQSCARICRGRPRQTASG
jgi:hypothetical protein